MRETFRFDVYNVIIIALIPFVLLVAWGLTWTYERNLHAQQCDDALTYLEEAADIAPAYTGATSLSTADDWLESMQALSYPPQANDLHNGAVSAFTYASTAGLDVDLEEPAGLYEQLTTFRNVLDDGRETLIEQCPDTAPLVAEAFPMYFREDSE